MTSTTRQNKYWLLVKLPLPDVPVLAAQDPDDLFMHSRLDTSLDRTFLVATRIACDKPLVRCRFASVRLTKDHMVAFRELSTERQINCCLMSVRLHDENLKHVPSSILQHRGFRFSLGRIKPHLVQFVNQ